MSNRVILPLLRSQRQWRVVASNQLRSIAVRSFCKYLKVTKTHSYSIGVCVGDIKIAHAFVYLLSHYFPPITVATMKIILHMTESKRNLHEYIYFFLFFKQRHNPQRRRKKRAVVCPIALSAWIKPRVFQMNILVKFTPLIGVWMVMAWHLYVDRHFALPNPWISRWRICRYPAQCH